MRLTSHNTTSRARRWLFAKAVALGPIALMLLVSPATPLAAGAEATAAAQRPFVGSLPHGGSVVIRLSRDGRQVRTAKATLWLNCDAGGGFLFPDVYTRLPVRHGSRISSSFHTSFVDEGVEVDLSGSMNGRLNRRRTKISGTWRLAVSLHDTATGETDHCDSGALGYSARR